MIKILDPAPVDDTIYPPLLYLIPDDSFWVARQQEIKEFLQTHTDWQVWSLDEGRALAISHRDLLGDYGVPRDASIYDKLAAPLFQDLEHYLVADYTGLTLNPPADRFSVQVLLETTELENRHCMHMQCQAVGTGAILARVYATRKMKEADLSGLCYFLMDWFQRYGKVSFNGECLNCEIPSFDILSTAETKECYSRDGLQFVLPLHTRLTWPWLELYLAARRTFSKHLRPSFEFLDAPAP